MPSNLLVVAVDIDPGVEDAWNRWYNEVHLPEIAACPGFRAAARYVGESEEGRHYLSIYDIEGPQAVRSPEFVARRGWGEFRDKLTFKTLVYRRIATQEDDNG